METFLTDGTKIYYEIYGHKKNMTLIFLHGNMEDSSFFSNQIKHFKEKFQVIVFDSRGHGKSDWGDLNIYSLKQMSKDLSELITLWELGNYFVIGFSDGANIGMEFAKGYREGLKGLVLVGGNLRLWGMKLGELLCIFKDYLLTFRLTGGLLERKKLGLMLFEPRFKVGDLDLIRIPTLVVAGEKDLIKRSETLRIGKLIRGSKTVFLKGEDHYFIYNNYNDFNKMLENWTYGV